MMRIICIFLLVLVAQLSFAQVSIDEIQNVNVNELSQEQIATIHQQMQNRNISISEMEGLATANGMSASDITVLKSKLESYRATIKENASTNNTEEAIEDTKIPQDQFIEIEEQQSNKPHVYGSQIFTNASLSFEPNSSMVTPPNYVLGPGDELQIVIYGLQEYSGQSTVSKEGVIRIPNVGQVYVAGLTFSAAEVKIKNACSKIYSTLQSGRSELSVTLSEIRTIGVTIIGAKRPGNYSVSSLSTVFNALHIAGGPNEDGSYRKIELIRDNKVIQVVDIYQFLAKGDQSANVNLLENDVIRIPVYDNRIQVKGNVKRPGIFELLPNETFKDVLTYAGGFDQWAYTETISLLQNTEDGPKVFDLTKEEYNTYKPQMGDVITVGQLSDRLVNKVSIRGSVYRPGDYEFTEGLTVSDLIKKAEGVTRDAFLNRAVLIRLQDDLTKEITDINVAEVLKGNTDITLQPNDELVISSLFDLDNARAVTIGGQVENGGQYPFVENMTLYDLILLAGGFTDGASQKVEISSAIIKDEPTGTNTKMSEVRIVEVDSLLLDQSKNIPLQPYDVVQVRKKPSFETAEIVSVIGAVEYPGNYVIMNKTETISDVIKRAGGLKYEADKNSIRVIRQSEVVQETGEVKQIETIIPIDYGNILLSDESEQKFNLQIGDRIIVGEKNAAVKVLGAVQMNSEILFSTPDTKYYIDAVGGFKENADKKRVHVIYSNGFAAPTKSFLGIRSYPDIQPGASIIVPTKDMTKDNKLTLQELASITGIVGSLATMAIVLTR